MIDYREHFGFENEVGRFEIEAYTIEHPSGYGNGTLLCFDIESDFPVEGRRLFDVRYSQRDIALLARDVIFRDYGVEL